jgi:hypothetical protein
VDAKLLEYKRQLGMAPPEEDTARTMTPVVEPPQTNTQ